MSLLTAALAGSSPGANRLHVAASNALAASLASGLQAAARGMADSGPGPQASLSSPPRPATAAGYLRGSTAPSFCLAATKTRRRRGRRPDNEPGAGGGGDDDGSGSAGGGGAGWSGPWDDDDFDDEEADPSPVARMADVLLWRMGCLVVALQVMHWVLVQSHAVQRRFAPATTAGFATLSQAFFSRRAIVPRAGPALFLQAA